MNTVYRQKQREIDEIPPIDDIYFPKWFSYQENTIQFSQTINGEYVFVVFSYEMMIDSLKLSLWQLSNDDDLEINLDEMNKK